MEEMRTVTGPGGSYGEDDSRQRGLYLKGIQQPLAWLPNAVKEVVGRDTEREQCRAYNMKVGL